MSNKVYWDTLIEFLIDLKTFPMQKDIMESEKSNLNG